MGHICREQEGQTKQNTEREGGGGRKEGNVLFNGSSMNISD